MSRRDDRDRDRYDDRDRDYRPRPRRDGGFDELDIDIRRTHSKGPERRAEPAVLDRRDERRDRVPDFLREDYGRPTETQQLVIRERRDDDDNYSRVTRRRSNESMARPRGAERIREEEIIIRERERDRDRDRDRDRGQRLPYPSSDVGRGDREEIIIRESPRSQVSGRAPPGRGTKEEIDITIRRKEEDERSVAPPRSEIDSRSRVSRAPAIVIEKSEIDIHEHRRASPPRSVRGRDDTREEIDIRIRETERTEPRPRSRDRGALVARKEEEWVVRKPRREPSPPPPRDYEKEEIIIRRRERSISPEPVREPSPEPPPAPMVEPIIRPPIIQEVITHYRNIDHGFERAREPTPPPPPPSPPQQREEDLEIAIRRSGVRNGKQYDDELIIDRKEKEEDRRAPSAPPARRRSPSRPSYDREIVAREVDIHERRTSAAPPPARREDRVEETRIDLRRTTIDEGHHHHEHRPRTKERMWTEVTKDLVIKEAITESGYEFEETDDFYYVMEYLRYEDVVRLVELTDDIRRERRERLREIQLEREEREHAPKMITAPPPLSAPYDERIYEREYIYDRDSRRYR